VTAASTWVPRPVSDLEMAWLRGCLTGDAEATRSAFSEQLALAGDANGVAMLMYAAFVITVRRRFAPRYTRGDLIGYVARLRAELSEEEPGVVDPLTAEDELRGALGEKVTTKHETGFMAAARLFILIDLAACLDLDDTAMTDLLSKARNGADQMITRVRP
jgi:hypothetical protein